MKSKLSKAELDRARASILKIANQKGVSEAEVRDGIMEAIRIGMTDPDPEVQAAWGRIPCAGEIPTPEELIAWSAREVVSRQRL